MYQHFGNIGERLPVNIFLSHNFAKCRPYVIRMRTKLLTDRFYTHAVYGQFFLDTDTDGKNSPKVI